MFFAVSRVHFTEVLPNVFTIVNNYALYLLFLKFQSHIRWNVHSDQFEYFAHWSTVSTDRSRKFIWEQSKHYLFYCIKIHVSFYWNCIPNVHRFFLPYTLDFDFLLKQLLALKCLEIQNWKGDWPRSLSITLNGFCFCLLYLFIWIFNGVFGEGNLPENCLFIVVWLQWSMIDAVVLSLLHLFIYL